MTSTLKFEATVYLFATSQYKSFALPYESEEALQTAVKEFNVLDGDYEIWVESAFDSEVTKDMNLKSLNELATALDESSDPDDFIKRINIILGERDALSLEDAMEMLDNYIFTDAYSQADAGAFLVEFTGYSEQEGFEKFEMYFDYEKYVHDLECNGEVRKTDDGEYFLVLR